MVQDWLKGKCMNMYENVRYLSTSENWRDDGQAACGVTLGGICSAERYVVMGLLTDSFFLTYMLMFKQ